MMDLIVGLQWVLTQVLGKVFGVGSGAGGTWITEVTMPRITSEVTSGVTSVGWRPFLDPLPLDDYFLLFLLPLIVVIAVVYKTIKLKDLSLLPRAVVVLTVQIIVFMTLAAAVLWLVTEWL